MKKIWIATSLLAASGLSMAAQPNYDYVELGYHQVFNESKVDPAGADVTFSTALGETGFFYANYADLEDNSTGMNLNNRRAEVGLGYRYAVSDRTDFNFSIAYVGDKFEDAMMSDTQEGYAWNTAFRIQADEYWEFIPYLGYERTADRDGLHYGLHSKITFTEGFSAFIKFEKGSEDFNNKQVVTGVRFDF
jgi:hypothetical protein